MWEFRCFTVISRHQIGPSFLQHIILWLFVIFNFVVSYHSPEVLVCGGRKEGSLHCSISSPFRLHYCSCHPTMMDGKEEWAKHKNMVVFFTHMCRKLAIREFHCVNDTYCFWSAVAVAIYFAVQATGFKKQDMALTQWSLQFASLMGRELWAEHVAMLR